MSARNRILAAGLAVGAVVGMPSAALAAEDYVGKTPPEVEGNSFSRQPEVRGVTAAREPGAARDTGATLPVTGGDIAGLALVGLGAVGTGVVLLRRGRTRSAAA